MRNFFVIILLNILLLSPKFVSSGEDIFIESLEESFTNTFSTTISDKLLLDNYYIPTFNDESYLKEIIPWNIEKINADKFWNLSKGEGVKIAVVDTGIDYDHPELKNRVKGGISFIDSDYMDYVGHGTAIAGIIAAEDNDIGVVGVAPEADLYAVKVMDEEGGYLSDILKGLQWALKNDMDIVTMSFGSDIYIKAFEERLNELYSNGIVLIAAAGNDGDNNPDDDIDVKLLKI